MDFLSFTDFATRGGLGDHLGHSFPKYSNEVTLMRTGKLTEILVMQILKPYSGLLTQNLCGGPRNHISFMALGRSVKLFKPELPHL